MNRLFTRFANAAAAAAGSHYAFFVCLAYVFVWAATGPIFGFSDTWQLVINTSTTIVTFLMVFLIQNTQNRDNGALHAKLDELIRATVDADNEYIGIEHLTDRELKMILERVEKNAKRLHEERRRRHERKPDDAPAKTSARQSGGQAVKRRRSARTRA